MAEKYSIENFEVLGGRHCQTTALRHILHYDGIDVPEETLLGLGGGIGFIYWYMKQMPAPFVGGRGGDKGEGFLCNAVERIGGKASIFKTASEKKAHDALLGILKQGKPAYTFGDMAYLPYFALPDNAHFGGHTFAVYGIDEEKDTVNIADRGKVGLTTKVSDLKKARGSPYPPFKAENKLVNISSPESIADLAPGMDAAIRECINGLKFPAIKNFGLAGMEKWSKMVKKWPKDFEGMSFLNSLFNIFIYVEVGGTGGAAFRPMYATFLDECSEVLERPGLSDAAEAYRTSAEQWSTVAAEAMPDEWPALGEIRKMAWHKNTLFEDMPKGYFPEVLRLSNEEEPELWNTAVSEMGEKDIDGMMKVLSASILKLRDAESSALEILAGAME